VGREPLGLGEARGGDGHDNCEEGRNEGGDDDQRHVSELRNAGVFGDRRGAA
jgi:hypothetical protein